MALYLVWFILALFIRRCPSIDDDEGGGIEETKPRMEVTFCPPLPHCSLFATHTWDYVVPISVGRSEVILKYLVVVQIRS